MDRLKGEEDCKGVLGPSLWPGKWCSGGKRTYLVLVLRHEHHFRLFPSMAARSSMVSFSSSWSLAHTSLNTLSKICAASRL